jgi:hypothetical protein
MSITRYTNPFARAAFETIKRADTNETERVAQLERDLKVMEDFARISSALLRDANLTVNEKIDAPLLAGIEAQDEQGHTLLHAAALHGRPKCLKFILDNGANKEARTDRLETPIHLAIRANQEYCVRILIDAKADIETKDIDNFSPLLRAAREPTNSKDQEYILRSLIAAKADVNVLIVDKDHNNLQYTALSLLVGHHSTYDKEGSLRALLEAGADPNFIYSNPPCRIRYNWPGTALTLAYRAAITYTPHYSFVSMLHGFNAVVPEIDRPEFSITQIESVLSSQLSANPDNVHINFCMGAVKHQKGEIEDKEGAIFFYKKAALGGFASASYRLGCIQEQKTSDDYLGAGMHYSIAVRGGDFFASSKLADLAYKAALRVQSDTGYSKRSADARVIKMCHQDFQSCHWKVKLTTTQWTFFAEEALVNNYAYREPMLGVCAAIVATKMGAATAKTLEEHIELARTSRNAWRFFHNLTRDSAHNSKDIEENVNISRKHGAFFSSGIVAEYCDDKLVATAVKSCFKQRV